MHPIYTGTWGKCHIQGIAADEKKDFIYYSFTTKLVKARLSTGEIVGSVDGLLGHLGCIAFNPEDGRVYGSLEYKSDAIGKGILKALGSDSSLEDAFYIAIFDVDKIDRLDMNAEKDGIMTAVYLREVFDDYKGVGKNKKGDTVPHRYGCSGIDGTTFGPLPGDPSGKQYLFTSYGIYSDKERDDNDHQVLLCYDTADWKRYERPLSQGAMHQSGPDAPFKKLFFYTGNTVYGVQNLEYSPTEQIYLLAVYKGQKPELPNYDLFAIDATKAPVLGALRGIGEEGLLLSMAELGPIHEPTGLRGWRFPHGSTGLFACQNGDFLISEPHTAESGLCSYIYRYVRNDKHGFLLKG
ncbi:MAG: hypothetical protein IJY22_08180 [Clostridia bacterium]|nr:hypothetical protein [Clostridia bacterium]